MGKQYPFPSGKGKVKWISTEWVEDHLDELMILDVQPNIHDYILEHIPGARYVNEGLLRIHLHRQPAMYVPEESIQVLFRRVGLEPDTPVVIYTGPGPFSTGTAGMGDGLEQTMMAYSLARFGHNSVHVLDGGFDKWKEEGRPVTKEFPEIDESRFTTRVRSEYFVEYNEFKRIKDRDDTILLDARPPGAYEGAAVWIKPGHIPGAVNLPWKSLMDPTNTKLLKSDDEIHAVLTEKGVTKDKTVICSCGTGREATNEFILLNWYLQYPKVVIYEGSFTEWSSYPENPTVAGKNPR
jgi:thiosulfate/3-mercaptopyruvate sulfurtransferase